MERQKAAADTRVIENGKVFEKGGVNISAVHGNCQPCKKNVWRRRSRFLCMGLSLVLHPKNQCYGAYECSWGCFVEIVDNESSGKVIQQWFGGGFNTLLFV
jgi:coproporphyrinogen III oxidase